MEGNVLHDSIVLPNPFATVFLIERASGGQPFAWQYASTSMPPWRMAIRNVTVPQHPLALYHCKSSRFSLVITSFIARGPHGILFLLHHLTVSRVPELASDVGKINATRLLGSPPLACNHSRLCTRPFLAASFEKWKDSGWIHAHQYSTPRLPTLTTCLHETSNSRMAGIHGQLFEAAQITIKIFSLNSGAL